MRLQDKNVSSVVAVGHDGSVYEISDLDKSIDVVSTWKNMVRELKRTIDRKTAEYYATDYLYKNEIIKLKKR